MSRRRRSDKAKRFSPDRGMRLPKGRRSGYPGLVSLLRLASTRLAHGDPLGALNLVANARGPHALVLRGVALAQLREYARARQALGDGLRQLRRIGDHRDAARAAGALAELELSERNLGRAVEALEEARSALEELGDRRNARYLRILSARLAVLAGDPQFAEDHLLEAEKLPAEPSQRAVGELAWGELAQAKRHYRSAAERYRSALDHVTDDRPALRFELEGRLAGLEEERVEWLGTSGLQAVSLLDYERRVDAHRGLLIDGVVGALRHCTSAGSDELLRGRPTLLDLARELAVAGATPIKAEPLFERAFRQRYRNASHHARLKVSLSRLRQALPSTLRIAYERGGWRFDGEPVAVVATQRPGLEGAILALLDDGESWSSAALALALGRSGRQTQRVLTGLIERDEVVVLGSGRATRYLGHARWQRFAPSLQLREARAAGY